MVGGKNASLGEMYRKLSSKGIKVPNGFAVTAYSYNYFMNKTGLWNKAKKELKGLNTHKMKDLTKKGQSVRTMILKEKLPNDLEKAIVNAYNKLEKEYGKNTDVAVRSSATAEDLPEASFAGQQESFLNIRGEKELLKAVKKCFASLFTNRAISYRTDKGFGHFSVYLSVGVQKMVRSDLASSGVMFSIDTETGFRNVVLINSSWGLGESVVQGSVNPDEFIVFKPTLKKGKKPILKKTLGEKKTKIIYSNKSTKPTKKVEVGKKDREKFSLNDKEITLLAKWACVIEEHYGKPMDIEWAKNGKNGELFIVQARPETVQAAKSENLLEEYRLKAKGKVLARGISVGEKIGKGKSHIIKSPKEIGLFRKGEVLVTDITDPDWEPIMKIASAIVTNKGGRTCHSAIISRELGIPCVVGTNNGTRAIPNGRNVTVDCSGGKEGIIYDRLLDFSIRRTDLKKLAKTRTKIMMNIGNPEKVFELSFIPNDGVGLAREEFIISSYIKVHPIALINFNKLKDKKVKKEIEEITKGYKDKKQFFIDKLAEGVSMIAAAFYPKDVIIRLSDFKTNEYANLVGGRSSEPKEENPMIGWRGASRYYSPAFREGFALECAAIKKVREEMGLVNVTVMIPFCRTVEEGKKSIAEMKKNGLVQGRNGLEVYVMCEIPSNSLLAEEFADIFDGFSIGSNDLTQLTLGLDRDSSLVSHIYDERNEAVKKLIEMTIKAAKKKKKKIGICGQAPSDFPEFAEFLVGQGIDSISLNPDSIVKMKLVIAKKEAKMRKKK